MVTAFNPFAFRLNIKALGFKEVGVNEAGEQHAYEKCAGESAVVLFLQSQAWRDAGRQWRYCPLPAVVIRDAIAGIKPPLKPPPI